MVTWFAGLFYLPRLFVYHASSSDETSLKRFKVMERKLYYGIMTPGAVLTLVFGIWLTLLYGSGYFLSSSWLHIKLALVLVLILYHFWCGKLVKSFQRDNNQHSHVWFRWFNEFPVLILIAVVILVVVKPIKKEKLLAYRSQ